MATEAVTRKGHVFNRRDHLPSPPREKELREETGRGVRSAGQARDTDDRRRAPDEVPDAPACPPTGWDNASG